MIHLQLSLTRDGSALIGQIGLADGDVRSFTGWIGLNGAIEELLDEAPDIAAVEALGRVSSDVLGGREGL